MRSSVSSAADDDDDDGDDDDDDDDDGGSDGDGKRCLESLFSDILFADGGCDDCDDCGRDDGGRDDGGGGDGGGGGDVAMGGITGDLGCHRTSSMQPLVLREGGRGERDQ
ncbi:unnamed protein product [Lampetra planeri]